MQTERAIPLHRLRIQNFGCIRDVTMELEPLTVLVGPNDSGKSMLLRALMTLSRAMTAEQGWLAEFPDAAGLVARTFNRNAEAIGYEVRGSAEGMSFRYDAEVGLRAGVFLPSRSERFTFGATQIWRDQGGLSFRGDPSSEVMGPFGWDPHRPLLHLAWTWAGPRHQEEFKRLVPLLQPAVPWLQCIASMQKYSLRPEWLGTPQSLPPAAEDGADVPLRLSPWGHGLAYAIAELLLRNRDPIERIEGALSKAMPHVKRIEIMQPRRSIVNKDGTRRYDVENPVYKIEIVTRSGVRIPSDSISDGVLLFLGYLYLTLGPDPARILLIEEPETGIHPGLLRRLMQLFRDMTTGAHGGPPTQIILTTHSPLLLNLVEPHEIRVFQRGEDGATSVTPFMARPDIEKLLDYQGPGEIWVNEGEDYLVGKPGT